jgi:hypothetical protein
MSSPAKVRGDDEWLWSPLQRVAQQRIALLHCGDVAR